MGYLKKGDNVFIMCGNDKGKSGNIMSINGNKVIVRGVNVRKKTVKSKDGKKGSQVMYVEMPVHISNVALSDSDGNKIKGLKVKREGKEKSLVYQKDGKEVCYRTIYKKRK